MNKKTTKLKMRFKERRNGVKQAELKGGKSLKSIGYAFFCVSVLLFSFLLGFTLARMNLSKNMGEASNTAKFVVTVDCGESLNDLSIDCNEAITYADYAFSVSNFNADNLVSEVSVQYKILVVLPKALEAGVELTVSDCVREISEDKTVYTFSSANNFLAGEKATHDYTLRFTADSEILAEDIKLSGIQVFVNAEQGN